MPTEPTEYPFTMHELRQEAEDRARALRVARIARFYREMVEEQMAMRRKLEEEVRKQEAREAAREPGSSVTLLKARTQLKRFVEQEQPALARDIEAWLKSLAGPVPAEDAGPGREAA